MPIVTILFGIGLIPVGWSVFEMTGREHYTALFPVILGILFIILGILALRPGMLKHAMHTAAMLGVVGAVGAGGRAVPGLVTLAQGQTVKSIPGLAGTSITTVLCLVFVLLCVRSFIEARKRQKLAREQQ